MRWPCLAIGGPHSGLFSVERSWRCSTSWGSFLKHLHETHCAPVRWLINQSRTFIVEEGPTHSPAIFSTLTPSFLGSENRSRARRRLRCGEPGNLGHAPGRSSCNSCSKSLTTLPPGKQVGGSFLRVLHGVCHSFAWLGWFGLLCLFGVFGLFGLFGLFSLFGLLGFEGVLLIGPICLCSVCFLVGEPFRMCFLGWCPAKQIVWRNQRKGSKPLGFIFQDSQIRE